MGNNGLDTVYSTDRATSTKQYVPQPLRHRIIQYIHDSHSSGESQIHRTTMFIQSDGREFVDACWVYAQSHTPHQMPIRLLELLPIPQRLWSHIELVFGPNSSKWVTIFDSQARSWAPDTLAHPPACESSHIPPWTPSRTLHVPLLSQLIDQARS